MTESLKTTLYNFSVKINRISRLETNRRTKGQNGLKIHLEKELRSGIDLLGLKALQRIDLRLKVHQGKYKKLTRTKLIMIRQIMIKVISVFMKKEI